MYTEQRKPAKQSPARSPSSIFTREMRMRKSLVRIRHGGCCWCRHLFSWRRPASARSIPLDSWPRRRRFLTCCCSCPRGPRLAEAAPGASRRRSACQGGSAATQKQRNAISRAFGRVRFREGEVVHFECLGRTWRGRNFASVSSS
jgi:hypothetical protein